MFKKCDFLDCDLGGTDFLECVFEDCNLRLSTFVGSSFKDVKFLNSKLVGIDFTRCNTGFLEFSFSRCSIDACNFSSLPMTKTVFEKCFISECIFGGTDLRKAEFTDCDLKGTLFHEAKMAEVDFSSAKNYSINPITNNIKGAKFSLPEAVSLLQAFGIKLKY